MQPADLTALVALTHELDLACVPARLEQVYQSDRHTIHLQLRTLEKKQWLLLSWHPQSARLHLCTPPPKQPDTFTFSQQILHQVAGFALVSVKLTSPWERVVDLQFAKRPDDEVQWHLYLEVMGKYSNAILVNAHGEIVTAAHQVSSKQSRVRPIQTGDRYALPPALLEAIPNLDESFDSWRDRLILIPKEIKRNLVSNYRGVSSSLVRSLLAASHLNGDRNVTDLTHTEWESLYSAWQLWLTCLDRQQFYPHLEGKGYSLLPPPLIAAEKNGNLAICLPEKERRDGNIPPLLVLLVNVFCDRYYSQQTGQVAFQQLHQQISQAIHNQLAKLSIKEKEFFDRLQLSTQADDFKNKADLLMAHLHLWEIGMKEIKLTDFHSAAPVIIPLDPTLNAQQNAQSFYKKHQKQKRAALAITPLLEAVQQEIAYLEQVATAVSLLEQSELSALQEIRAELAQQGYLKVTAEYAPRTKNNSKGGKNKSNRTKQEEIPDCHRFTTPNGFEVWVGRNNYQNDLISFRIAGEYDLWLHAQEISGSHVLLRLPAGAIADDQDLQTAANYAAYYSRARQSDQVPVVCTIPKYVFKPKGAKPGMVVYTHEKIIWGQPTNLRL
ncbi:MULTISPECIES: Rqc2 family fibronectin-binding protein [Pseudanabaena]|uniref:Rqc2 homolog RqcH n=2 Tax=Pseudanabaena TaxID=1152 RepID=L8MXW8_9CYAN|nr:MULTISPECIES: NFACT RNA binding domain-containing protein [Pseudanabaena]ELS30818.1 Fibronectin-binding A domain protein [Pseudanabaena biceps PCC 7429]MDG3496916.1 NFACT RNA binding domain-containing protein [Pseudanabaena catenata USMAC16]